MSNVKRVFASPPEQCPFFLHFPQLEVQKIYHSAVTYCVTQSNGYSGGILVLRLL